MQQHQQELWSTEPHPIPQVYQQLTAQQRSRLVNHLAHLMVKLVQNPPTNPPPSNQLKSHER
jgi:hypothetical protein